MVLRTVNIEMILEGLCREPTVIRESFEVVSTRLLIIIIISDTNIFYTLQLLIGGFISGSICVITYIYFVLCY